MCLFITTTNYLNNTKDVFDKIKNNDTICIIYGMNDEGLNVDAVEKLFQKNIEKKFMYLNRDDDRAAAFNLGLMLGMEKDKNKEIVLLSEDELFVLAATLMKEHNGFADSEYKMKDTKSKVENEIKVPAKRGRKPKAKPQEIEIVSA